MESIFLRKAWGKKHQQFKTEMKTAEARLECGVNVNNSNPLWKKLIKPSTYYQWITTELLDHTIYMANYLGKE
jgi:hypothetical protein